MNLFLAKKLKKYKQSKKTFISIYLMQFIYGTAVFIYGK